jgi:CHAT domain-containing protein
LEWFREGVRRHAGIRSIDDGYDWREAQGGVGVFLDVAPVLLEQPGKSRFEMESELFDVVQQFKLRTLIDRITEPRRMDEPSSQFAALQHVDLRTVQREVLKDGELFLDFSTGEQVGYLFAVTSDSCRLVTIPGRMTDMVEKVALYRQFLGQHPSQTAGALEPEDFDRYNRSMGAAIFGEVADLVESASVLLISPSKFYGGVPFGALSLPGSDGSYRQLIRSHEIQMVPSATVLAWHRSVEPGASGEATATGVLAIEPVKTGDLPGAHEEVESLRRRFAGVTVRHEPGRLAVSHVPASTGVVHIAAHTEVNDEKPWHSGILLGNATGEFAADPYLRAGDIASVRLPARLVVLSGCETAMGRPSVGEGVAGLTSAFLSAGVRSVVATLWRVDDDVTADLIGRFYEGLADGQSVAAALRHAQLAIGALPESSHPFYWAGFVVVGDASVSVNLVRKPSGLPSSLLLVLLGVVALGLGFWILNHFNKLKKSSNAV